MTRMQMMKPLALAVSAVFALGVAAAAGAQMVTPPNKTEVKDPIADATTAAQPSNETGMPWKEDEFLRTAVNSGMTEVELSQLAQQKTENAEVRELADMLVKDHTAVNGQLRGLAETNDVTLPSAPDATSRQAIDRIAAQSGSAFDRAYVEKMAEGHQKSIALYSAAADSGEPRVRDWAKTKLATLRQHAAHVDEVQKSLQ